MSKVCSYTAVPTDPIVASNEVEVEKDEQRSRRFKCLRVASILLIVWAICGAVFDDDHHHRGHHHAMMKHSMRHDKLPTKLPGGGRDWLVNAVNGTIHAKHNPSLVLGVDTTFPLVLVQRSSPNQLNFGPPPKNKGAFLPFQDSSHKLGVVVGDKQHVGEYHVRSTKLSPDTSEALVSYQEDNFIVLENSKSSCRKHEMVLNVEDWNLREFQPVKFVEGPHWDSFASIGGGRDFHWEKSGSISLKLNPNLVLGHAPPSLILVDQDSKHKIVLQHAQELANGEPVELTIVGGGAIGQRDWETREYGPWHYIESQVGGTEKGAIVAKYDGNFILANNGLALDVSFWELEPGTPVNFVGGSDYLDQQNEQTQSSLPVDQKSTLRGSYTLSSSSDTSSRSSADSSLSSSESSNINMMGEEVYDGEDFVIDSVIEDEAFDDSQEEMDLAILANKDLPPPVEEILVVNRLNGD